MRRIQLVVLIVTLALLGGLFVFLLVATLVDGKGPTWTLAPMGMVLLEAILVPLFGLMIWTNIRRPRPILAGFVLVLVFLNAPVFAGTPHGLAFAVPLAGAVGVTTTMALGVWPRMSRFIPIIVVSGIAFLFALGWFGLRAIQDSGDVLFAEERAPGGEWIASWTRNNPGAMGSVTDVVSVRRDKADLLREQRVVYLGFDAWDNLPMSWAGPETLLVRGHNIDICSGPAVEEELPSPAF